MEKDLNKYGASMNFKAKPNSLNRRPRSQSFHEVKSETRTEHSTILYIGNLNPSVVDETIEAVFSPYGNVVNVRVLEHIPNESHAFIEFTDHESAKRALEALNNKTLVDRQMKIQWSYSRSNNSSPKEAKPTEPKCNIYVRGLVPEIKQDELKEIFQEYGAIVDAKVVIDYSTQESKGFGFVEFVKHEDAERAMKELNGKLVHEKPIQLSWGHYKHLENSTASNVQPSVKKTVLYKSFYPRTLEQIIAAKVPGSTSVYVSNIHPSATEEFIYYTFEQFGKIISIRYFTPQQYAFLKFENAESAVNAIFKMDRTFLMDFRIRCWWGRPYDENEKSVKRYSKRNSNVYWSNAPQFYTMPDIYQQEQEYVESYICVPEFLQEQYYVEPEVDWTAFQPVPQQYYAPPIMENAFFSVPPANFAVFSNQFYYNEATMFNPPQINPQWPSFYPPNQEQAMYTQFSYPSDFGANY